MKLWCTSFIGFKRIAYKHEWDEMVPNDTAIISINNGKDAGTVEEYHICKDAPNVLNLNFLRFNVRCKNKHYHNSYKSCNQCNLKNYPFI